MNPKPTISTLKLERFVDSDLPDEARAQVAEQLRADPALRARLAGLQRLDQIALAALTTPAAGSEAHDAPVTPARGSQSRIGLVLRVAIPLAAAAAVILAFTQALRPSRRSSPLPGPQFADSVTAGMNAANQPFVRVVHAITVPAERLPLKARRAAIDSESQQLRRARSDRFRQANAVLAAGNADDAADLLKSLAAPERLQLLQALAASLSSSATAGDLLDRLDADDQIALLQEMARKASLRPMAFERLRRLAESGGTAHLAAALQALSADESLRVFVRGYRLPSQPALAATPG